MGWFWHEPDIKQDHESTNPDAISLDTLKSQSRSAYSITSNSSTDNSLPLTLQDFIEPRTIVATVLLTTAVLLSQRFYKRNLRRITSTSLIPSHFYRTRNLFGHVLSVGDADNFRLYHTPGGALLGYSWFRKLPTQRKIIHEQTIHIRIAGVDAPELAHFGKPAQPHSAEALAWLKDNIAGRKVRCVLHRRDQYDRAVATVWLRRVSWLPAINGTWLARDVGGDMIKAGWATVYEAKQGSEFGGKEEIYKHAEANAKSHRRGMWGGHHEDLSWLGRLGVFLGLKKQSVIELETPRAYKTRMAREDETKASSKKT